MKKLLILLLAILCLVCCGKRTESPEYPEHRLYYLTPLDNTQSLYEIEYEDHKYLVYYGLNGGVSMIHSASCWCQEEGKLVHHEIDISDVTLPEIYMDTRVIRDTIIISK